MTPTGNATDETQPGALARIAVRLSYLLPQHLISRFIYRVMRIRHPGVKNLVITWFCRQFGVDLSDAESADPDHYPTFNAFFTRALASDARPIDNDTGIILCPVDGRVSQTGSMRAGRIVQAKNQDFNANELLGGDERLAERFSDGVFATIYLAPYNYHRIHMPCSGTLTNMTFVPGRLFSVNAASVAIVPRLFARNERVVTIFETDCGLMALVLVGALNVGSIETVWAGEITPGAGRTVRHWRYDDGPQIERGEEMGRFNMGSTVILMYEKNRVGWDPAFVAGQNVRMGQSVGTKIPIADHGIDLR